MMDIYALTATMHAEITKLHENLQALENEVKQKHNIMQARIDRLYFRLDGKKQLGQRICKDCGMIVVGDEEHECRVRG